MDMRDRFTVLLYELFQRHPQALVTIRDRRDFRGLELIVIDADMGCIPRFEKGTVVDSRDLEHGETTLAECLQGLMIDLQNSPTGDAGELEMLLSRATTLAKRLETTAKETKAGDVPL